MGKFSFAGEGNSPQFTKDIEMLNNTDPNSNTLFNGLFQKMISNDMSMNFDISNLVKTFVKNSDVEFKDVIFEYTGKSDFEWWKEKYKVLFPVTNKIYVGTFWHSDQEIYFSRFYTDYSYGNTTVINCLGEIRVYRIINYVISAIQYSYQIIG